MMFKEGDWIIDKQSGLSGGVLRVYPDGITARFGTATIIRKNENIEIAALEIHKEDWESAIDLALATRDYDWAREISNKIRMMEGEPCTK